MIIAAAVLFSLIFLICLWLIFTEKLDRSLTSIAGAALMVGVGIIFKLYTESDALAAIDFNTLGLLLGMMILPKIWNKRGLPVMLVTCAVASILYAIAYPLF